MAHVKKDDELLMEQVRQQVREQVREEVSIALRGIVDELHGVAGDLKVLVRRMEKVVLLLHQDGLSSSYSNKATQCELQNSTSANNTTFRVSSSAEDALHMETVHQWRQSLLKSDTMGCPRVKNGSSVSLPSSSVYRTLWVRGNESPKNALLLPGFTWHIIGHPPTKTSPTPSGPKVSSGDDNNNDVTTCVDDVIQGMSSISPPNMISMSPGSSTTATSGSYSVREDTPPSFSSSNSSSTHSNDNYNQVEEQLASENPGVNFSYEQIGVVKKRHHGLRKLSLAYSISPEADHSSSGSKSSSSSSSCPDGGGGGGGSQRDDSSPGSEYDGLYERELDERLELEFDDDLELFETIENGIHGTVADDDTCGGGGCSGAIINATYNRDINPWRQYSGVSVETISDDLWSDFSDNHSDNIVNENFVAPLLSKAKQHTNFHWRTYVEP